MWLLIFLVLSLIPDIIMFLISFGMMILILAVIVYFVKFLVSLVPAILISEILLLFKEGDKDEYRVLYYLLVYGILLGLFGFNSLYTTVETAFFDGLWIVFLIWFICLPTETNEDKNN